MIKVHDILGSFLELTRDQAGTSAWGDQYPVNPNFSLPIHIDFFFFIKDFIANFQKHSLKISLRSVDSPSLL